MRLANPRKVVIPAFQLTKECEPDEVGALQRRIPSEGTKGDFVYHLRPVGSTEVAKAWNLFAFPLNAKGRPWDLATPFLVSHFESQQRPDMSTCHAMADDLGAFRQWLDVQTNQEILFHFPKNIQERVTYRYYGYLKNQVFAGEVAASTAAHRMSTVIQFYRFLFESDYFVPDYPAWVDRQVSLSFKTSYGAQVIKKVQSTDLRVKAPKASNAFRDTILDGGELRPLTSKEQGWLLEALKDAGNPEMYYLLWFMVQTGARIQTACTLRVGFFLSEPHVFARTDGARVVKLKCGPGTLVDTKGGRNHILQIPLPLFEALKAYAESPRAMRRRGGGEARDNPNQYLFLTNRGLPYYPSKSDSQVFDPERTSSNLVAGGTVRKFVADRLLPYIRKRHDPAFHFKVHDLRATFGMNTVDGLMEKVKSGEFELGKVLLLVKDLLWHSRLETTQLYLNYRSAQELIYAAIDGWGEQLQSWIDGANSLDGGSDD